MREIKVNDLKLNVVDHWFWNEYNRSGWEPSTYALMKRYLKPDKNYIDLGTWVGPTVFYAAEIGVNHIYGIEANPVTFDMLKESCRQNDILKDKVSLWQLCVAKNSFEYVDFGPTNHVIDSSACSVRGSSCQVKTTTIMDWIECYNIENYNFIKIDIEGSEEFIYNDLIRLSGIKDLVILLSLHPDFWTDKYKVTEMILEISSHFSVFDSNHNPLTVTEQQYRMTYKGPNPEWGTKMGNFYEILLKTNV